MIKYGVETRQSRVLLVSKKGGNDAYWFLSFFLLCIRCILYTSVWSSVACYCILASFLSTFPCPFPRQKEKTYSRAPSPRGYKAPMLLWFFLATKVENNSLRYIFINKGQLVPRRELQRRGLTWGGKFASPRVLLIDAFYQLC